MRRMPRLAALLLILCLASGAAPPPAPRSYLFHIRIVLLGEVLMDQDMIWIPPHTGQLYSREWSTYVRDECVPNARRAMGVMRNIQVTMRRPLTDRYARPDHAFQLEIVARLPMTLRGRDGACAPNPAANETRISQVVILDPGQSTRVESEEHLVAEVMRP
jgi:hypothetical protein